MDFTLLFTKLLMKMKCNEFKWHNAFALCLLCDCDTLFRYCWKRSANRKKLLSREDKEFSRLFLQTAQVHVVPHAICASCMALCLCLSHSDSSLSSASLSVYTAFDWIYFIKMWIRNKIAIWIRERGEFTDGGGIKSTFGIHKILLVIWIWLIWLKCAVNVYFESKSNWMKSKSNGDWHRFFVQYFFFHSKYKNVIFLLFFLQPKHPIPVKHRQITLYLPFVYLIFWGKLYFKNFRVHYYLLYVNGKIGLDWIGWREQNEIIKRNNSYH